MVILLYNDIFSFFIILDRLVNTRSDNLKIRGFCMVLTWLGLNFAPETAKKIKERKRERKNKNNIN